MLVVLRNDFKGKVDGSELRLHVAKYAEEGKIPKCGVPDKVHIVDEIPQKVWAKSIRLRSE